jgi:threonine dehydrogenase-like Zn-dependent dehydrogenase
LIEQDGRIIGHEGIARVLEIGPDTEGFEVGDWVVPSSIYHCGQCQPCRSGSPNQCDKATLLGAQVNGLFASIADIQVELLVNVTNHVRGIKDLIALATLEPASTALQACEMAGLSATSRVVIFGAGPIGAYCAMVAKNVFQCAFVAVVEPIEKRRNLVGPWADITCADLSDLLADLPWAQNLDAVIETSGHLDNINEVFTEVGANGRIVVLARSGEALHLNHVDHMITKAIKIQGCRGQLGGYMARVAELYSRGVLPLDLLVSLCGEGIDFLQKLLLEPDFVRNHNCKSMVRLNEAVPIEGLHN